MVFKINLEIKLILMKKLKKYIGRDLEQWESFDFDINFVLS